MLIIAERTCCRHVETSPALLLCTWSQDVSRNEIFELCSIFGEPVDLLKIVRGSHRPSNHHQPPKHLPLFQSILEFSSFCIFHPSLCHISIFTGFSLGEIFTARQTRRTGSRCTLYTYNSWALAVTQPLNNTSSGNNGITLTLQSFSQSLQLTSPHLLWEHNKGLNGPLIANECGRISRKGS